MPERLLYLARHGEAGPDGELTETGRQQASLLGQRLAGARLDAIFHGPLPRVVATAQRAGEHLPGVPVQALAEVGDYLPPADDAPPELPASYARLLDSYSPAERAEGARLTQAATGRFARPAPRETRELIVTHNFLIAWFVRHALGAPDWRWTGLNQANAAVTAIRYTDSAPPSLIFFNDTGHLPAALRWTGFSPGLAA
jgi:serine/threonine-protein phosphatase PGAM5